MKIQSGIRLSHLWIPVFLLSGTVAEAHPGLPFHTHGLVNGLTHPLTGLDHIAAMLGVGLWAAQRGGRALWVVPTVFVSVMALGGALGMAGVPVPFVEPGIAASVLILGILITASIRLPLAAAAPLIGLFALYHGVAHGAEMPLTASGLAYGAGFLPATALLLLCGIGAGLAMQKASRAPAVRYVGGVIAVCGLYLAANL